MNTTLQKGFTLIELMIVVATAALPPHSPLAKQ